MIGLCLGLFGCASASKGRLTQEEIAQLHQALSQQEEKIKSLQVQLQEKEGEIKELNSKLAGFGVFGAEKKVEEEEAVK
ncbi:MAG: hypothetical protein KKC42_05250 [Candidatus Omnitrophica bacterium]|nr:hypothetical protein [Candidatus Omnitrophota bacterium]MBU1091228.1 hypothetical protein [Candidatus Omnitrophota bacterium]